VFCQRLGEILGIAGAGFLATDETRMGWVADLCLIGGQEEASLMIEHEGVTQAIIGAAFEVHNELGFGYLEKVYRNAMQVELIRSGYSCVCEHPIQVKYKGSPVGDYFADLFVDECVIVELKVAKRYNSADEAQLLNELKATGIKVGLLINFGSEKVQFKRLVY
jgi:GxxExxY protein